MFKNYWQLLMLYLVLGVAADDPPADDPPADDPPADGPPADDPPADDPPGDDLDSLIDDVIDPPGDTPPPKAGRENEAIRAARERAQTAEEARIRAEATLEAERRMRQSAPDTEAQRLFEDEEARLRNPEVSEQDKYWIRANRTLRENTRTANQALTTAADMRDRTDFDRLAVTNPKVHKMYCERVEQELGKMRAKGQDAPRLALLRFMIGNDVMDGKLKSKPKAKASAAAAASGVDRGKPPGARSDMSAKGRTTESQKRRARLEGQAI